MNDNSGGWSYEGCFTFLTDSTHVRCYCDHLTSFAVILEMKSGPAFTEIHRNLLSVITYIGCFLSIFGLGSIILTFIVFSKWRSELKHKVLFSLSLSLFFFLIIFLYGIERLGSMYGCMVVALLLHYFMLATFSWMVVEAVLQYYGLVKVIGTYVPRFIQKASLFAWGLPLIIVAAVLSVDYNLYSSSNKYCWVSNKVFYYAVAAPVLLMLAINFVIFGIISYSNTCGRSKKYLRSNQNEKQEMITRSKAVFCVSVLLGLSWVFGFLAAMDGAELMFQYLFTTTTTLQGFLFFVFFVLRQKKTRDLWLTFLKGPAPTASHNTGGTNVDSKDSQPGPVQNKLYKVVYRAKMM
ncbi:Adhesion G-protein coupled receptor G4 [Araneus ventricosus]|uniref:Adhesion G-protein coupled receptor G4 n=1 Tax=Araneus ventricosus TaxID=182803 RepID=A0A4Y2S0P5_ARAVE|nr:Adhesion G-protein coupled receptor G4 [Araneus ventricosus]